MVIEDPVKSWGWSGSSESMLLLENSSAMVDSLSSIHLLDVRLRWWRKIGAGDVEAWTRK
jgi:hypothetical protein